MILLKVFLPCGIFPVSVNWGVVYLPFDFKKILNVVLLVYELR